MSRRTKIVLGAAGAVAVAVVVALLVLPRFLDVERYRPRLERAAADRLGREVELGRLSFSFFPLPNLRIDGLRVASVPEEGDDPLLESGAVRIGVELLALLGGDLRLRGVTVEDARIVLYRRPDGSWSAGDLLPEEGEGAGDGGGRVQVDRIAATGASIVLRDAHHGTARDPLVTTFENADLEIGGLVGGPPYRAKLSFEPPGGGWFAWDGRVSPPEEEGGLPAGEGSLEIEELILAALGPYPEEMTGWNGEGVLAADLDLAHRSGQRVEVAGSLAARSFLLRERMKRPLDLSLELEGVAAPDGASGTLDRLALQAGELSVSGSGEWRPAGGDGAGEGDVEGTLRVQPSEIRTADLADLARAFGREPKFRGIGDEPFRLEGEVAFLLSEDDGFRRLEGRHVLITGLVLTVDRAAAGELVLPAVEGGGPAGTDEGKPAPEVRLRDLVVREARLRVQDRSVRPAVRWTLEDLSLEVERWEEETAGDLELRATLAEGGTVEARGSLGPVAGDKTPLDLFLAVTELPLAKVNPYLPAEARDLFTAGTGSLRIDRARGTWGERLEAPGTLTLRDAKARTGDEKATLDLPLEATWKATLQGGGDRIAVDRIEARIRESSLRASGTLRRTSKGTGIEARLLEPASLAAADLETLLVLAGQSLPVELRSNEPLRVEGGFRRDPAGELLLDGSLRAREVELRTDRLSAPLHAGSAVVRGSGKAATVEVEDGRIGESDFRGRFEVTSFEPPRVDFEVSSNEADLGELLSFLKEDQKPAAASASAAGTDREKSEDLVAQTRARGTLRIARGTFDTLSFQDLATTLALDGYEAVFDPFTFSLYEGKARARAELALGGDAPVYHLKGDLTGVDLNGLLTANTELDDELFGTTSLSFDLRGRGTGFETVVQNASGNGTLEIRDGKVSRLNVFDSLTEITGLFGEETLRRLSRRLATEGTEFSVLSATPWRLEGPVLRTDDLRMVTPDAVITGSGRLRLLEESMDVDARVAFSEALSASMREEGSAAAELFWDGGRRRVILPVGLRGPWASPRPVLAGGSLVEQLARKEAGKQIEKEVGGELGEVLGGIFGGKAPGGEDPGTKEEPGAEEKSTPQEAAMEPAVVIGSHKLSGNFLQPDLRFEGTFQGVRLQRADLAVRDADGRLLYEKKDAFPEIARFYESHDAETAARIPFSRKISHDELSAASAYEIVVTLHDAQGRTAQARFRESRGLRQLF